MRNFKASSLYTVILSSQPSSREVCLISSACLGEFSTKSHSFAPLLIASNPSDPLPAKRSREATKSKSIILFKTLKRVSLALSVVGLNPAEDDFCFNEPCLNERSFDAGKVWTLRDLYLPAIILKSNIDLVMCEISKGDF